MLSTEQIIALAPDASAVKAGQGLSGAQHWVTLGADEQAVWGECRGSGKLPYQTQIDLAGPAFKCTCPSHKFPCKHALGLFLLLAKSPQAFQGNAAPSWVADWLQSRAKREEKKASVVAEPAKPVDTQAAAKREAKRLEKVTRGVEELERWLCDLVRQGIAAPPVRTRKFWEEMAARMVDAQCPGLARLLRQMALLPQAGEDGQGPLLEKLGALYLLIERFKRLESLPESTQADVRALIGWTQSQEELLAGDGVTDDWLVLGQHTLPEERLTVQRTWLWGTANARPALLLQYAHGKTPFEALFAPGMCLRGELVYYPGNVPLRALVKTQQAIDVLPETVSGYPTLAEARQAHNKALTAYPWLEYFPLLLHEAHLLRRDERWLLRDAAGAVLPIAPACAGVWELFAVSGGHPVTLFGEWDGVHILPLSLLADGRLHAFSCHEEGAR